MARYPGMDAYADAWARQIADRGVLEHSDLDGGNYRAEIIASGAVTASQAMVLWETSPAHRDIMLNPAYTMAGIGYADGYWVIVFN